MHRALISAMLISIAAIVVAGCGGSDDETDIAESSTTASVSEESSDDTGEGADDDTTTSVEGSGTDNSGGKANGTLTLADGTAYDFEMSTCDTNGTKPNKFLVNPGYDIFGKSSDGWSLSLTRAGFKEESANPIGVLEIDDVTYGAVGEDDMSVEVDGSAVTGTVLMTSLDPGAPLGSDVELAVDISC